MLKSVLQKSAFAAIATFALGITPATAYGFAEDMCMIVANNAPRQGKIINCFDLHCNDDLEFGSFKSARCTMKQMVMAGLNTVEALPIRGRSMVHFDATYVIAQALGMNATDAYWLAAYDQAVDQSSYQAYDKQGEGLAKYTTLEIPGVRRTNLPVGGTFFHFVPPLKPTQIVDRLEIQSDTEAPLRHVRDWAFGDRETLCRFALTAEPFKNVPGCFTLRNPEGKDEDAISFKFPFASSGEGPGIVSKVVGGEVQLSESPLPADMLPLIKMGVYIHAMADRISHHACCDVSPIQREEGRFVLNFGPGCDQATHASLHGLEVGHKELPIRTRVAIETTYDEISAWLAKHPEWRKGKPAKVKKDQLVADLLNGLKPEQAEDRVKAYRKLWDKYKICGLPGDEAKNRTCFPDVK